MGSDWDASSDEETAAPAAAAAGAPKLAPAIPAFPVVKKGGRYADEDLSDDDVKDSWDVSDDDDDDKPKKPVLATGSMRNKGVTKQKIAQKEEEDRRKAEEAERKERENDPAALRARARAAQLQADMDSAATLFGESSLADNPLDMECRNKEDFAALATSLSDLLIQKHSASKHFGTFVDDLAKALAQTLKSDEVGKVRATMAALAIDKQKVEKAVAKGPAGKPPARMVARGKEDLSSFGEVLDDEAAAANFDPDEDFM